MRIKNGNKILTRRQTTKDIVGALLIAERESQQNAAELMQLFCKTNPVDTARGIHSYIRENVKYYKEPPTRQNVKTAARVLHDKVTDCKGYATLAVSALRACGIPAKFRLASYSSNPDKLTHVYAVAIIDGRKYIIDGTLPRFNEEAAYIKKVDINTLSKHTKSDKMALHYMNAAPTGDIGFIKKAGAKLKGAAQKVKAKLPPKPVAVVAAAPARGAALTIISLNIAKTGTKLANVWRRNPRSVEDMWKKFGGDIGKLKKAVEKGSKSAIGAEPVSMAAVIAAATPILVALSKLFKENGEPDNETLDMAKDGQTTLKNSPLVQKASALIKGSIAKVANNADDLNRAAVQFDAPEFSPDFQRDNIKTGGGTMPQQKSNFFTDQSIIKGVPNWGIIAGGAVAAYGVYTMTRKKRR